MVRALGQNPTEAEVKRLVQNQKFTDGRVAFETFLPILHAVSQKKMTDTVDDFVEGLRHFDKVKNNAVAALLTPDIRNVAFLAHFCVCSSLL